MGCQTEIKFLAQKVTATSGSSLGRPSEPIDFSGCLRVVYCGVAVNIAVSESKGVNKGFATTAPHFSPLSWHFNQFEGNIVLSGGGQLVQDERPAKKGSAQATAQASALKAHTREQPPSWSSKYKHRRNSFCPLYFTIKTTGRKNPKRRKVLESGHRNV